VAVTSYPVNHPAAVKKWSREVMVEALKKTSFLQDMGTGSNSICQIKNDLKQEGDRVRIFLRMQLSGRGTVGDGTQEGNEESLAVYHDDVYIDQLSHAVRTGGRMSEHRVPFSVRDEGRDGLSDWWADRFDDWYFNQLCGNATQTDTAYTGLQSVTAYDTNHVVISGTAGAATHAATASMTSTNIFSLRLVDFAVEKAKTLSPAIRPIRVNNESFYKMYLHPYQVTDMRTNTDTGQWLDIQKEAAVRGRSNPIFSGALGVYNGVILAENTRVPTGPATDAGGATRRAVLAGAQAAAIAFGKGDGPNRMTWVEELFDYERQLGIAASCIGGLKRCIFNSETYGSVQVLTAADASS
jgi:N4-gp56 family major capsid protein